MSPASERGDQATTISLGAAGWCFHRAAGVFVGGLVPPPSGREPGAGPGRAGRQSACSVMVTDSIVTRSLGLPDRVPTASIVATVSSPATTLPNSE